MRNDGFLKCGLAFGAGILVGAVGLMALSRSGIDMKKAMAGLVSHGMDLKDKAVELMETAKENLDDLAAEARHESEKRRVAEPPQDQEPA